jgi:hypothetical protein
MVRPEKLLRIFSELVMLLLGMLLVLVAVSGRLFWDRRSLAWVAVGIFLIYWGLRAWMRRRGIGPWRVEQLRSGSLALVGVLMLAMSRVPFDFVGPLLGVAGGVLIARGIFSVALLARS